MIKTRKEIETRLTELVAHNLNNGFRIKVANDCSLSSFDANLVNENESKVCRIRVILVADKFIVNIFIMNNNIQVLNVSHVYYHAYDDVYSDDHDEAILYNFIRQNDLF